jgi:nitrous oxidase accessory protein NosD
MKTQKVKIRLLAGLFAVTAAAIGSGNASGATLSVCPSGCAFSQIAPALAAAKNGDTISIGAGTYNGGLTIDKSVRLVGAGSGRTTISGGGPVLTIGTFGASSEPTVTIGGVTITGGVTHSSWNTSLGDGVIALGGGIEIPPNADFSGGATVAISNSVITGNRVAPSATAPSPGGAVCPGGLCPFAGATHTGWLAL